MSDSQLPQRWSAPTPIAPLPIHNVGPSQEQESTLKAALQLVALIRRHWLLVLAITAGCVGILVYRIRNEPRIYRAMATIRLEDKASEISNGMGRSAPSPTYWPMNDPVLTQIEVLQSQAVAESVAEREGLRLRALPKGLPPSWATAVHVASFVKNDTLKVQFTDSQVLLRSGAAETRAAYGDTVSLNGVRFVVPRNPGFQTADLALISATDAANEVRGSLTGREREKTDIIDVYYTAADPLLAQRIANAAVRVFQDYSAETARLQSRLRRQFIATQLQKTEGLLADARAAHNAFRSREKVYSSQEKFRSQQADLSSIDLRRQELVTDRGTYVAVLNELQHVRGGSGSSSNKLSALAASPGIATNTVVSQLFGQLISLQSKRDSATAGPWGSATSNPFVQALDSLIASSEAKVENAVRANLSVIEARIAAFDTQKATVAAGIAGLPQAEATEATLLAQVTTYSRQVDVLRDELQSAEIAEAAEMGQVEIVDLASASGVPIGSGRKPKLVLALMLGLILSTVVAYVLENYRPVIRARDELEAALALPNLALVPQIRHAEARGNKLLNAARMLPNRFRSNGNGNGKARPEALDYSDLVTLSDARSSGAEAYRTLRTNLLFSAAVRAVSRIVVTSPGPEEGKSTTAANLAIAFAQQGHRVLLIDCDLRRARIHKIFDDTSIPGLTSVLVGGESIASAIRQTRVPGLNILPSGPLPPNPAELLGSQQMTQLMDTLSENYDLLILDTPPLLAASDAAIASRIVDGALVVVRAGRTEKSALQTAVQQLSTVGARVLGTVLNDPDAEVPKYARYYGYYYNNYYDYSPGSEAKA